MKKLLLFLGVGLVFTTLLAVAAMLYFGSQVKRLDAASLQTIPSSAQICSASDIEITSVKWHVQDECRTQSCAIVKGVAKLKNNCRESVGVQIKAVGVDKAGALLSVNDFWPASDNNIPPGEYVFSLDQVLDYQPEMKRIDLAVNEVKMW